jgi:hypothetical protein
VGSSDHDLQEIRLRKGAEDTDVADLVILL